MMNNIQHGDYVVLVKNFDSGNMKIVQASVENTVHYGKLHFNTASLVGAQFGSVFEIDGQTMRSVDNFEDYDSELSEMVSKKMTTLNDKSQFSQEKIIKKKKKRAHANIVTAMRPTIMYINEMLFARKKIGGLRCDILGQILTLSNVQNGIKCMIVDHNLGIITSAVMSRILPDGICVQILPDYESMCTTRKTMNMLNIKETECPDNLSSITVRDLYKVSIGKDSFEEENLILQACSKARLERLKEVPKCEDGSTKRAKLDSESSLKLLSTLTKKDSNRESRNRERIIAAHHLKQRYLDSLIMVVQNDHPLPLLKMLYPFLLPSRQFVIYSDFEAPLIECYQHLKTSSLAISMHLSVSWLRHQQVLPDRTRPEMNVSGYGGYILSGTKALFSVSEP